mmetsp:Transcript_38846/g.124548  ORF Transcript_38846/g.124548 Transcript_38846/m.124548 type:complete len:328 (-) Transcript_38846:296-1279(-)
MAREPDLHHVEHVLDLQQEVVGVPVALVLLPDLQHPQAGRLEIPNAVGFEQDVLVERTLHRWIRRKVTLAALAVAVLVVHGRVRLRCRFAPQLVALRLLRSGPSRRSSGRAALEARVDGVRALLGVVAHHPGFSSSVGLVENALGDGDAEVEGGADEGGEHEPWSVGLASKRLVAVDRPGVLAHAEGLVRRLVLADVDDWFLAVRKAHAQVGTHREAVDLGHGVVGVFRRRVVDAPRVERVGVVDVELHHRHAGVSHELVALRKVLVLSSQRVRLVLRDLDPLVRALLVAEEILEVGLAVGADVGPFVGVHVVALLVGLELATHLLV